MKVFGKTQDIGVDFTVLTPNSKNNYSQHINKGKSCFYSSELTFFVQKAVLLLLSFAIKLGKPSVKVLPFTHLIVCWEPV